MMVFAPASAWAQKRVALVVGNSAYQNVPQLANPAHDAESIAKMLRDAGFDSVELKVNVGNLEFKRAIRKFEEAVDQADIAVVYYAGHGLEIGATNYLIPVDARLASDNDADDEAISLERLVSSANEAKSLRLIILDACRDNPLVRTMRRERKTASRAINSGLSLVTPTTTGTLIAYAAKAGSKADDGDDRHSPFTTAVLKNLSVPGLDVRLAFGRVRDDVMKETDNRQEPFVYGSLGGSNVSLVPAPAVAQEAPVDENEVKGDYDLVQKIGTKRAWEVFLRSHPTGFYAELARAQIESLDHVQVASLPTARPPSNSEPPSKEQLEWEKVKDATNFTVLQKFIRHFPNSPLALNAQQRIDLLKQAAQEREEQARAAREAAKQAAEETRRRAEEQKAAAAAQKKREEDERRAREAEAAERAKAAAAEAAAKKQREENERRAEAAEAARKAKEAEAVRKAEEARQMAEKAEREKAVAAAAAARAAAEKQAQAAEAARKQAEAAAERQAQAAEAARKQAEAAAAKEATCKDEQTRLDAILVKGSEGSGIDDLKAFSSTVTCDRLGPVVAASLDRFNVEAAKREATRPNSLELVRSAQTELIRLGCFTGRPDGSLASTQAALSRYLSIEGLPADNPAVTQELVAELTKHQTRACPLQCKDGETQKGDSCVVDRKPEDQPVATLPRKSDDKESATHRRKEASRQQRSKSAPEAPRARQQATARPSIVSGGGGGTHGAMIGVGF